MIIIFPLVPVVIGIILVAMSLANELQGIIDVITTVVMMILVIIAIIIFIVNFVSSRREEIEGKKFFMNSVAGIAAIIGSYVFFRDLNGVGNGLGDLVNFIIIMIIAGPMWLIMVTHWWGTCAEEGSEAVKCFLITIAIAIGMIII